MEWCDGSDRSFENRILAMEVSDSSGDDRTWSGGDNWVPVMEILLHFYPLVSIPR